MRKRDFCQCKNKGADQLCSNCKADQRLCFRNTDSTIPLLHVFKLEISSFFPSSVGAGDFVSDLVGNLQDRFSHITAQIV